MTGPHLVAGLDLSLTSTGCTRILADGTSDPDIYQHRIETKAAAGYPATGARLDHIIGEILEELCSGMDGAPILVAVEGPAYGISSSGAWDRAGLWWGVHRALSREDVPVAVVNPSQVKQYATGKGGGVDTGKDRMVIAAVTRYPNAGITGNDLADSTILAAMAARWIGYPIEKSLPALNLKAMTKPAWPIRPLRETT